jgi:hypothetical protein
MTTKCSDISGNLLLVWCNAAQFLDNKAEGWEVYVHMYMSVCVHTDEIFDNGAEDHLQHFGLYSILTQLTAH